MNFEREREEKYRGRNEGANLMGNSEGQGVLMICKYNREALNRRRIVQILGLDLFEKLDGETFASLNVRISIETQTYSLEGRDSFYKCKAFI